MESTVIKREQCPRCLDSKRDNLAIYDDGHSYCFSCGLTKNVNRATIREQESTEVLPMYTVDAVLEKRGVHPEIAKAYGVKMVTNSQNQLALAFPLADVNRAIYTSHYRQLDTSSGELTRRMYYEKGTKLRLPLFGWQLFKNQQTVVICEGETDTLILASKLHGRKDVLVVGMVGAANADRIAAHICGYLLDNKVVLAFDNDDDGQRATTKVTEYLDNHEIDKTLYRLDIPKEFKDVGDWIAADASNSFPWITAVNDAQPIPVVGILDNNGIADNLTEYLHGLQQHSAIELMFSPKLSEAMRLLPGKLIGIAGDSGQGKSTVAEHFMMEALQQQRRVFCVSAEMFPAEVALKLARMIRNEPLDNPRWLKQQTEEYIKSIDQLIRKLTRLLNMTSGFGTMATDKIDLFLHKLAAMGIKPDLVVVDHLLAICGGTEANVIMDVCKELKEIARSHMITLVLLSHVRKGQPGQKLYRPQLADLYGSSGLQIYADSVIAVASDKRKCETYVETIKIDRLGGHYADITLGYSDYCLHEVEDTGTNSYDSDDTEYTEEEQDLY